MLGPRRAGVGVIGAPVAKAAVVGAAISPGPSPIAKAGIRRLVEAQKAALGA